MGGFRRRKKKIFILFLTLFFDIVICMNEKMFLFCFIVISASLNFDVLTKTLPSTFLPKRNGRNLLKENSMN
jgi:hypothetical protein